VSLEDTLIARDRSILLLEERLNSASAEAETAYRLVASKQSNEHGVQGGGGEGGAGGVERGGTAGFALSRMFKSTGAPVRRNPCQPCTCCQRGSISYALVDWITRPDRPEAGLVERCSSCS